MSSHAELRAKAAATYNSAADSYDASANTFWKRFGRSTISFRGGCSKWVR